MDGHDPDVAEWLYRMMNDPDYYEKWFYKDAVEDYNNIIEHSQKLLEITPASQPFTRAKLQHTIRVAKRDLAAVQADYDEFKEFKEKTAIPK